MAPHPPSPRAALARWLAQIHYNAVRRVEATFAHVKPVDSKLALRGLKLADDLVLSRKRTFYRIAGSRAEPLSIEEVAANYNLEAMQVAYRVAQESWKSTQRTARRRNSA